MKLEIFKEVIPDLVGQIEPYGDCNIDKVRYNNQEKLIWLIKDGIESLMDNIDYKNRCEASVKIIGDKAYNSLKEIYEELKYYLEGRE